MEYLLSIILTIILSFIIIKYNEVKRYKEFVKVIEKQFIDNYTFNLSNNTKKQSQITQRLKNDLVKVIMMDGKAYWVMDNIFYMADTKNDKIINETAQQVDTENMSKKELDKMLFILDNLEKEE